MNSLFGKRKVYCCLLLPLLFALGCGGSKTAKLSGKVLFDNKPLPGGTITFYPADGGKLNPASTAIQEDGTYSLDNAPTGEVKVSVSNAHLKGANDGIKRGPGGGPPPASQNIKAPPEVMAKMPQQPPDNKLTPIGKYIPIPDKYGKPETSGLSTTIKGGNQTDVNFELKP
jgi:hypothetical protein